MVDVPDFRSVTVEALAASVRAGELSAAALTEAALDRIVRCDGCAADGPALLSALFAAGESGTLRSDDDVVQAGRTQPVG